MIAQIDPKTRSARYFDIRKLTAVETYRLMGVPEKFIQRLMATRVETYQAISGMDEELALLGLTDSAKPRDINEAADVLSPPTERGTAIKQGADPDDEPCDDDEEDYADVAEEPTQEFREQVEAARQKLLAADRVERTAPVPILSQSAHYKLAGNSIVADVLMYIYEEFLYPSGRRLAGEQLSMFDAPQFRLERDWSRQPLQLLSLCAGYDSQAIALDMLQQRHPDFRWRLTAWAEFDPDSKRPLDEQPAVVAHRLCFPDAGPNLGDMTQIDWPRFMADTATQEGDIDLLTYSTPCQSISQAGKREGMAKGSGTRSSVLWSTEDAVAALKPKILLQENVRAIINRENKPHFQEWCRTLERQGYVQFLAPQFPLPGRRTTPCILNSRDYGVPQNRDRLYMLSVRADLLRDSERVAGEYSPATQYEFPRPFPLERTIADVLEPEVSDRFFLKPQSVEAFLRKNETDPCLYLTTDRKLTQQEVEAEIEKVKSELSD